MKIAVTGASGFVGQHVLRDLAGRPDVELVASSRAVEPTAQAPKGVRHVPLDLTTHSPDAFDVLGRPDVVVHLAWGGLPNYRSLHHFESELPRQYAFLRNLIESGLRSLVVTGTCYEYGMQCGRMHEAVPAQPVNPYGYAKNALREQLEFLRSDKPFELTWARLFYMYGPGQAAGSLYAQLMAAIERGDTTFRMSGGEQLRDFLPIEEVAQLIASLALRRQGAGIVNVCSGRPTSVRSLVEGWIRGRSSKIRPQLGQFPYPDYEPLAFWGARDRLDSLLNPAPPG